MTKSTPKPTFKLYRDLTYYRRNKPETEYRFIGLTSDGTEAVFEYTAVGDPICLVTRNLDGTRQDGDRRYDLIVKPERRKVFINLYEGLNGAVFPGSAHDTKEDAAGAVSNLALKFVTTIEHEWEVE